MKRSKAGKAQKMKDLVNDPKTPNLIRGWIKQDIRLYNNHYSKVRLPPGYNLAHFRGFEAAKGYDYRFTSPQNIDLHLTQHKYDNNGLKNKTPTNINIKTEKDIPSYRSRSDYYEFFKKLESSNKTINPKIKIDPKAIKQVKDAVLKMIPKIDKAFSKVFDIIDMIDIILTMSSGDIDGALEKISGYIGGMCGAAIGRYIGGCLGGFFGPIGICIGSFVGGWIGDQLGSKAGEAIFGVCYKGAGLNEKDGKTGSVEIRIITSLKSLKIDIYFLFSQINLIAIPLKSEIPNIIEKLLPGVNMSFIFHRIIYELYYGIVVQHAPILFSLHFAKEGFLYPVIHPYYRNTLVGYILGFLDYFLKGFINGGVYKPEFLLEWDKTKNMDVDYLRQNIIDIREELKKSNLQSIEYLSLRELYNDDDNDDEKNETRKQKYFSAFRILGKTTKVQKCGLFLVPDCDFDVEHDLNPSVEVMAELSKSSPSEYHMKHKEMEEAYQRMHNQIYSKMPQIPLFAPWFDLLKIVSFGAHYVQTLIETGTQPCFPEPDLIKPFPTAMPPIPIKKVKTFHINFSFYDFMEQVSPDVIKVIDNHLYKIIKDEVYDFKLIEDMLKREARKIIIKKLIDHLPIEQIEQRDDSELYINHTNILIQRNLRGILLIPSLEILKLINFYKDNVSENEQIEALSNELKEISFKQQIDLIRKKLPPIIQQIIDRGLNNFDKEIQRITNLKNDAKKNLSENYSKLSESKIQIFCDLSKLASSKRREAEDFKNRELNNIEQQICGYSSDRINWDVVNQAKSQIEQQYYDILRNIEESEEKDRNNINIQEEEKRRNFDELSKNIDDDFYKIKSELNQKKTDFENCFKEQLKNIEKQLDEFENNEPTEFSSYIKLANSKNDIKDKLKNIILLDKIRLSFIDVAIDSPWCQNIRGGCSISSFIEPEVVLGDSLPFEVPQFENNDFETIIQNYLISGVKIEHRWYASPQSFVEKSLEIKDNSLSVDNLGGKQIIDFIIENGNIELLRTLKPDNINKPSIDGFSPLMTAVTLSNYELTKVLLEEFNADVNFKHPNGLTPLIIATQSGNTEISLLLLEQSGIQIDISLDNGMSPMHYAILNSDIQVIQRLTELGINADSENSIRNNDGCNAFLYASKLGFAKGLELMKVSNKDCCSADGSNALHWAAGSNINSLNCIEILYKKFGVSPDKQNCRNQYPLHIAIEARNDDSAIFLYDICSKCASVKDDRNKSPKELAIAYGAVGFLSHAFPKETIINNITQEGNRNIEDAIQDAIFRLNMPDTSRLINELANQKNSKIYLEKLINTALIVGSEQLLDIVIRATPDIKVVKFSHKMVLPHLVVLSGQYKLIAAVSKFGFSFDEKDYKGNTPLFYAVLSDDHKTMRKILKCRENTDNIMDLFKEAAQKSFETRKPNCIKALMKFQKKSKNQILINGTYLCNNLNITPIDVNKAIQMGLKINKSDVLLAAAKSTPEVLLLIIQYFCKEDYKLKNDIIKECIKIACNEVRLDNILALHKMSEGKMKRYLNSLIKEMKINKNQFSFWLIKALQGDPKNLIQKKIQEIGNLLKNGIDISFTNKSGVRNKMFELLQEFPLKNMPIENGMPFLYYAFRFSATWAFSCVQNNYDISQKIGGSTAYDLLPFSSNNLSDSFWDSPNINQILESLTFEFSTLCVKLGCSNEFISSLCKTVAKKSKRLNCSKLLHILIHSKASIEDLEPIIISRNDWCKCVDENGWTPLIHAVFIHNYEISRLIIKNIPSEYIETRNFLGNNVLHILIISSESENRDFLDFAMELISKCPQILRVRNRNGQTPCSLAAYKGLISLISSFGSFGYFDSEDLIHSAAAGNQVGVIKFLMNSDCSSIRIDPNLCIQNPIHKYQVSGDNFLHTAARNHSVDAFIELVKIGTNPIEVNSENIMPIEIAFSSRNFKMIEFLLTLPSIINASSLIKNRAITSCAIGSSKDVKGLEIMIKCGFPINSINHNGYPLIHCAALSDNADAIHLVLNSGADIFATTTSKSLKTTVLHLCASTNRPNSLRTCLEWASFCLIQDDYWKWIDAKNEEDCTALHLAAKSNNDACVSILLAYGANPNCLNSKKLTPAQFAVVSNSLNSLGILIQVVKDKTYNGIYPLEYTDIVEQFKEKIKNNEISIPQILDLKTIKELLAFTDQVKQRLLPLKSIDIKNYENPFDEQYLTQTEIIKYDEFNAHISEKYGENSVKIVDKFSFYPLSQIQLIKLIDANPQIIDELFSIIQIVNIDMIASIIPNIPIDYFIPFLKTVSETIKISEKCPEIWEWFKGYFTFPCVNDEIEIPDMNDFTEPFDYLIMVLNETKCINYLPLPKLPRLSVFIGKRCTMLTVKKALERCTDKVLQIKNINEIPLNVEKIEKVISCSYQPKYFGNSFLWCRDGSIILDMTRNIQRDGYINSLNVLCNLDGFALLTIRAMFTGVTISNLINDFKEEKEDTKYMIIKIGLQLSPSDFTKIKEWCAAGLFCSEQCGSGILKQLCDLISSKKCSINDILDICSLISRMSDTSKIESALVEPNPKEKITELMSKENNSKGYLQITNEMSTSLKGEFQPYKYAFDGTPVICLPKSDIIAFDKVYEEMIAFKSPSTMREIQAEVSRLGKEMALKPNLQSLGQLLEILSYSFEVVFKIRPYLIQCLTVAGLILSEINPINGLKGRIAQVATGEGKSIDIVLLASICAAQGRYVDIITSTHYLAKRDYLKFAPFYEFIGLSCGCIAKEPHPSTEDFNGLILYGINTDFEFTILREGVIGINIQKTQKLKGGPLEIRFPDTVITDESDNLFIDNAINSARISWKSNEDVSWVFAPLFKKLSEKKNLDVKAVRKFLYSYLKGKFSQQVSEWSDEKLQIWISSYNIALNHICGRDYVIGINSRTGQKEIQIVNLETGRIHHGSRWTNGIHEFIEVKEGLIPENEDYTIASISHPAFFGRYKHIYGLTGTAGELVERNEVMKTYHVDSFDVPPNRKCHRIRYPTEILLNNKELQNRLVQIAIETKKQLRPLLLLFLSIDDTIKFSQKLSQMKIPHMVLNELQRENEDYIVFRAGQPGVVTIATNTAGRGTDIILSPISKKNGGLRVAFTFFPQNFRVECQGLGRAGRQGQPGTAEIITSLDDPFIMQLMGKIKSSIPRDESFIKKQETPLFELCSKSVLVYIFFNNNKKKKKKVKTLSEPNTLILQKHFNRYVRD